MEKNTLNVFVHRHIHGLMEPAHVQPNISIRVREPDIPEVQVQDVAENTLNANAKADIAGAVENVRNSHLQAHLPVEVLVVFHVVITEVMDVFVVIMPVIILHCAVV